MKAATVYGGLAVTVGSKVVYPGRRGSSLWLNEGVVDDITVSKDWRDREYTALKVRRKARNQWEKDGQIVTITELDRVVPFNG